MLTTAYFSGFLCFVSFWFFDKNLLGFVPKKSVRARTVRKDFGKLSAQLNFTFFKNQGGTISLG